MLICEELHPAREEAIRTAHRLHILLFWSPSLLPLGLLLPVASLSATTSPNLLHICVGGGVGICTGSDPQAEADMHGWQDGAAVGAETERVGREVLRVFEDEAGPWGTYLCVPYKV